MTHRVLVPLMLFALSGFGPHPGQATVPVPPSALEKTVAKSDVIARVRIHAVRKAEFTYDGERSICGWVYSGEVREAIKGSSSPIEFLSFDRLFQAAQGVDRDYLIFATEVSQESAEQLGEDDLREMPPDERATRERSRRFRLCVFHAARYFIEFPGFSLFPLEASSARDTDLVLVLAVGRALFKVCPTVEEFHSANLPGAPVIRWECARRAIEDQLRR